ncbi:MAG: class I SAM-dependent methyltransferase, partial [Planctomycetaceae bacterium]|nr:class I SAM-dependent methyltransferase [Planctomycetaceae bacterium]
STVRPVLYDGRAFPFDDDAFEVAIILFVLHHIRDQDTVLSEVRRVARRVMVAEDLITGPWQRWFTYAWDSCLNFEFFGHPHSNRTDDEWRAKFAEHGWRVARHRRERIWGMTNGLYELVRN